MYNAHSLTLPSVNPLPSNARMRPTRDSLRAMVWCLLLAVVTLPGCITDHGSAARAPVDLVAEEQALQELWQRFELAFAQGDAAQVASYYAIDADRIAASGVQVQGREQIQQGYAALLARRAKDPTSAPFHATMSIRFLRPDVALMDGRWTGVRSGAEVHGLFTLTATKDEGRWYIAAGRDLGIVQP